MSDQKPCLADLSLEALQDWLKSHQQPAFRAKQIHDWLYKKCATSFAEMGNLPQPLRQQLEQEFLACALAPLDTQRSDDGTTKWLSQLADGNAVETVLIPAKDRITLCLSTQVGCAVRCAFCASGKHGLVRNLTPGEIVDQVRLANHEFGTTATNLVIMGIGEPMHNRENLVTALNLICSPEGLGLGARHITISTSGIVPEMRLLADEAMPWNLAISLHAVNDAQRARIIPPQHRYPIREILAAARYYREKTNRMFTIEYALVKGLNSSPDDAASLASLARENRAKVNLIPCNNQEEPFLPPPVPACRAFLDILTKAGVQASLRLRRGEAIKAACGQLKASHAPK
ncbi:MAG: 23S rRNA (adenine(2503)-C(2))-methyltransferase RlmN [Victivallales bacterium]|nr:23S rRNA (adenine(2503)-C(2))-methyltransferase RlmN [Victivallales bacterium]